MSNTINLNAETGANYIGDDTGPSVTFSNSSTGAGAEIRGAVITSTASIDVANLPVITSATADGQPVLDLQKSVAGNYSTATLKLTGSSTASGAVIELSGTAFTSIMSIDFGAGTDWASAGGIRVKASDGDTMFWIPLLPESAIEAAAAFE